MKLFKIDAPALTNECKVGKKMGSRSTAGNACELPESLYRSSKLYALKKKYTKNYMMNESHSTTSQ